MSFGRQEVQVPDVIETAEAYREHLMAELARVEEFLAVGAELMRIGSAQSVDWVLSGDEVPPRRLHS